MDRNNTFFFLKLLICFFFSVLTDSILNFNYKVYLQKKLISYKKSISLESNFAPQKSQSELNVIFSNCYSAYEVQFERQYQTYDNMKKEYSKDSKDQGLQSKFKDYIKTVFASFLYLRPLQSHCAAIQHE